MKKIVGYEREKTEVAKLGEMLRNAEYYRKNGVRIPRGLLLTGEPGVGKTVLAKSIAVDGINLVELRASTCCDENTVDAVKSVFEEAKTKAPTVLLLDELDKIAGSSMNFFMEDNDRIKKTLLQELDDLTPDDNILVIATCNDESCISGALTRSGRFDRHLHIDIPDEKTRLLILKTYFGKIKVEKEFNIEMLAKNTYGFTGAKLECLANESGIVALSNDDKTVDENVIRLVLNKLEFGTDEKDPFEDYESLHRVAVHEAGHALAVLYLLPDCLYGASVMPQGKSNGHIRFIPNESRVQSVAEIENEAAVMLAGHVAERIILGGYLSGSSEDIQGATMRLHYLISREAAYGYDAVLSGVCKGRVELSSDGLKMQISRIIEEKLIGLDSKIEQLIFDHSDVYVAICNALEEKRVLTREDLLKIKNEATEKSVA